MNLQPSEDPGNTIILSIALPSSFLSIVATSLVFIFYCTIPRLQIFPFRLVVYLQIADFIMSCGQLLTVFMKDFTPNNGENYFLCNFQAYLCQFGALSTIIWAILITSLMAISMHKTAKSIEEYERVIILIGFHFPAFFSIIPFLIGGYGSSGAFCWIDLHQSKSKMIILMIFMYYIFLWFAMVFNSFMMLYLRSTIIKLKGLKSVKIDEFYSKIKYFPLVMIMWWSVPSIHRIYQFVFQDDNLILAAIHVFCESSYGFANMMLYALNPRVKSYLKAKWRSMFQQKREEIMKDFIKLETCQTETKSAICRSSDFKHTSFPATFQESL